jgi:hypothetical protein
LEGGFSSLATGVIRAVMVGDDRGAFEEHEQLPPQGSWIGDLSTFGNAGQQVEMTVEVASRDRAGGAAVVLDGCVDDGAAAEVGFGVPEGQRIEHGSELVLRVVTGGRHDIAEPRHDVVAARFQDSLDESFSRAEVAIQGLFGDAKARAELGDTNAIEAALVEHFGRRSKDRRTGSLWIEGRSRQYRHDLDGTARFDLLLG